MKNIEILIGSPRKKGNTYIMAEMLINDLNKKKTNFNISFLYDFDIQPCIDCRACKKDNLECSLQDDMQGLYKKIESSDILIIGTPIYWFGPSAKTKLLLDRMRPYYANKKLSGKQIALLLPAGTGSPDCDLTIEMFKRSAEALEMGFIGFACAKAYDMGEVSNDIHAKESISALAGKIDRII